MSRSGRLLLKILPAFLVLTVLLLRLESKHDLLDGFARALARPEWLFLGFAVFFGCLTSGFLRWFTLLKYLAIRINPRLAIRLYALSHAMNLLTPGATGGDVFKAAALAYGQPGRRAVAMFSVVVDRISGLFWLMVMVSGIAWYYWPLYDGVPGLRVMARITFAVLLAGAAFAWMLAWRPERFRGLLLRMIPEGSRLAHGVEEVLRAGSFLLRHPRVFFLTAVYSLMNHVGQVFCAWAMARALGIDLSWQAALAVIPFVTLLASVPLTPGGLGVREAANQWLLGAMMVSAADAIAMGLLTYGIMLSWAVIGAVLYGLLPSPGCWQAVGPDGAGRDRARPA